MITFLNDEGNRLPIVYIKGNKTHKKNSFRGHTKIMKYRKGYSQAFVPFKAYLPDRFSSKYLVL